MRKISVGILLFVGLMAASVALSQSKRDNSLAELSQLPVSAHEATQSGVSSDQVKKMTRGIKEGNLNPSAANQTLKRLSKANRKQKKSARGLGKFVKQQVENGIKGKELAKAIQRELNQRGIPAGGNDQEGPPEVADRYRSKHQKPESEARQKPRKGQSNKQNQQAENVGRKKIPEEVKKRIKKRKQKARKKQKGQSVQNRQNRGKSQPEQAKNPSDSGKDQASNASNQKEKKAQGKRDKKKQTPDKSKNGPQGDKSSGRGNGETRGGQGERGGPPDGAGGGQGAGGAGRGR